MTIIDKSSIELDRIFSYDTAENEESSNIIRKNSQKKAALGNKMTPFLRKSRTAKRQIPPKYRYGESWLKKTALSKNAKLRT